MIDYIEIRFENGHTAVIDFQDGKWYYGNERFEFLDMAILHAHKDNEQEVEQQRKTISAQF